MGDKLLYSHNSFKHICDNDKYFFGHQVMCYISSTNSWMDISQCCCNQPLLLKIDREPQDLLKHFRILLFQREDKFICWLNLVGEFMVKSAYIFILKDNIPLGHWAKIWNQHLIPKINFFWWTTLHNKIVTQDKLSKSLCSL